MSDMPFDSSMAAGPAGPGQQPGAQLGQPSEEEVRQYLAQMRGAPVEQVLAEVLQGLLNGAQIKLGRRDGRLLLDSAQAIVDQTRPHLSDELAEQVEQALSQLKMAQVEAENEVAQAGRDEPNDLGAPGGGAMAPGPDGPGPSSGQQLTGQPEQASTGGPQQLGGDSPLNKLWIPGR